MDQWVAELGPTADGWLGSTAGITDEGWFVGLARFDSESAARRNSERPEQGAWWSRLEGALHQRPRHSTRAPRSSSTSTATWTI